MLQNYLLTAARNFVRGKFYSIINLSGLAVALAVFLVIVQFIYGELNYDRFNSKADRIFRVATHLELGSNVAEMTATYPPLAAMMATEFPEIEKTLRLWPRGGKVFKNGEKVWAEDILYAGQEFFDVFDLKLLAGDPRTALADRDKVVLTRGLVAKYFGAGTDDQAVLGKSLIVDGNVTQVTGVIEDAPQNSHFTYKALVSIMSAPVGRDETWGNMNLSTYILVHRDAESAQIENKFPTVLSKHVKDYAEYEKKGIKVRLFLQPLTSIHLHSHLEGELSPTGSITTVYILGSIALIVLLLASVNFMNLTTARSAKRAKEVGIRKVLGSNRGQLVKQFLFESVLMVVVALVLSFMLLQLFRVPYALATGSELSFALFRNPLFLSLLAAFALLLGTLAGSYPSFFLASFNPAEVLKGKLRSGLRSGLLRNSLVILQFVFSIGLITCTLVVQNQLQFMRSKKLGFDKDNLVVIENANKAAGLNGLINELKKVPGVVSVATAAFKPVGDYDGTTVNTEDDKDNERLLKINSVDYDYFETMQYRLVNGRAFSRDFGSDSSAVVLNEAGARYLFDGDPVGKKIFAPKELTVVGVVADFNFESLKSEVRPLMFFLSSGRRFLHVRLAPGDHIASLGAIERTWKSQNADIPFTYTFVDDDYNNLFREEARLGTIFNLATILAVFIASLGLLGLAAYSAEQRTKEISVRKVMGASVPSILVLFSMDFVKLVAVAIVLATPLAYYLMTEWLTGFAYRVEVGAVTLAAGATLTLLLSLTIVVLQSLRTAMLNPAKTLKYE